MFDILNIEHIIGENEYFMRTKVVIKNSVRFGIAISFLVIIIASILMISIGEGKGIDKEEVNWIYVKVKEGDTLWTISKNFIDQSVDIRDYIYFIRKANKLEKSSLVYPGQVLKFVDIKTYKMLLSKR